MWLFLLYCGFYVAAVLLARALTRPPQALSSGLACLIAAIVASLTLAGVMNAGFIEPWLVIAMLGAITIPAGLIGLGLLAGWMTRVVSGSNRWLAYALTALPPVGGYLLLALA